MVFQKRYILQIANAVNMIWDSNDASNYDYVYFNNENSCLVGNMYQNVTNIHTNTKANSDSNRQVVI